MNEQKFNHDFVAIFNQWKNNYGKESEIIFMEKIREEIYSMETQIVLNGKKITLKILKQKIMKHERLSFDYEKKTLVECKSEIINGTKKVKWRHFECLFSDSVKDQHKVVSIKDYQRISHKGAVAI